nr:hypothetical protein [Tanacetum cinerariifolium]
MTERIRETYKSVSQDIRDQLNAEAKAVQIILTGIDNDIYSTVDACPNAYEEPSKDKEIDKLMALISLSFKKIYKPTNNNLRTSSNTSRANQDNSPITNINAGYENQRISNVAGARENVEVSPNVANSGPIFDDEPLQKVSNDDHCNVFSMESTHPEQSKFVHDTYPIEHEAQNVIIDSLDMNYDRDEIDQDDDNDLAKEPPDSDEVIRLEKESRLKLSDLIRPFDYDKLNHLYDLFVPQREKSSEQRYFSERSRLSHINVKNGKSKESFNKQTTLLEKRMDESISLDKRCQSSLEIFKVKSCLNEEMVADLRYFNSLESEIDSLRSQLQTQKTQFLNEIDRLLKEYYYADHMNIILGVYTELDEVTHLQCDYIELLEKCEGVIPTTSVSRPQLKSNPQGDRVMHNNSQGKKQDVEDPRRIVKLSKNKTSVTVCNDSLNAKTLNVKFVSAMYDKCVLHDKHDMCVLKSVVKPLKETVASESNKKPRNFTRKLYECVSKTCRWWYPKFTPSGYKWKPKPRKENVNLNLVEIVLFIVDSECSKHMTGNLKPLINFVEKFLGTVKFGNDQIAPILGYGDLVQGAVTIKMVYYIEGLNHNLFSISQCCDADLEVAFRKSTCYIRDLKGNDLLTEATSTACFTQNCSLVIPCHEKTPYHSINDRKLSVKFFYNFGSVCYIVRDGENLDKMKEKDQLSSDPAPECQTMALNHDSLSPTNKRQANVPQADRTVTTLKELDLLFSSMFDELLYGSSKVVSKSSAVSVADAPNQRQHHTTPLNNHTTHAPTCQAPTLAPTVISSENINQAETYAENDQVADDEFIN